VYPRREPQYIYVDARQQQNGDEQILHGEHTVVDTDNAGNVQCKTNHMLEPTQYHYRDHKITRCADGHWTVTEIGDDDIVMVADLDECMTTINEVLDYS
jgi:hypothetical protein